MSRPQFRYAALALALGLAAAPTQAVNISCQSLIDKVSVNKGGTVYVGIDTGYSQLLLNSGGWANRQ